MSAWNEENRRIAAVLAKKVRSARQTAGLSQENLARVARLHRTEIGQIERGTHLISLHTLLVLADALQVDRSELLRELPIPQERRTRTPADQRSA